MPFTTVMLFISFQFSAFNIDVASVNYMLQILVNFRCGLEILLPVAPWEEMQMQQDLLPVTVTVLLP